MSDGNEEKRGWSAKLADILGLLASGGIIFLAYMVFTNKIPKSYWGLYSYFYLLAIVGFLGTLGEKFAATLLAFAVPLILSAATLAMKYKPEKFPLEDWWDVYSIVVLFSSGFVVYLFVRWEQTKQMKGLEGSARAKARVDPAAAAKYRSEQEKKSADNEAKVDAALGTTGRKERKLKGTRQENKPEPINPDETPEERMEREMKYLKDEVSRKSMKLSTTMMRMKKLTNSLDRDEIFASIIEIVCKGMDAEKIQLLLNDEKEGKLRVVAAEGMSAKEYRNMVIGHEEPCLVTFLAKQRSNDVIGGSGALGAKECEVDPKTAALIAQGKIKTILAAPIFLENKVFAVINVEKMKNPDYTRDDQNLLATCADVASLVMKNAKLYSATVADLASTKKISEEQLRRNEELRGSLSRIVSPSVAELILNDPSGLKLGGNKCIVTMFFSDIRGFTKMSENMDPTEIVEQLNIYFTRMTDILMELEGTLDKYVGDELMALFGAPVARPDDPVRAVLCGVKMMGALKELQERWKAEGKPVIQIGIGINTGEVTAGYMGSEKQLSYTVIGDNVNLAARVMANAKPMELLITRSTFELVKDFFITEVRESIMVKGKSMPIEIFLVKGVNPQADFEKMAAESSSAGNIVNKPGEKAAENVNLTPEQLKQNIQIDDKPKVIECANCGVENDMQTKFCRKCGMPIF